MRWFHRWAEKLLKRYYEGFPVPERYYEAIELFASQGRMTRQEWANFTEAMVRQTYAEAYVRGLEYAERDVESWFPEHAPEEIADAAMPGWRDTPIVLDDPNQWVEETVDEAQVLRDGMDRMLRYEIEHPVLHPLMADAVEKGRIR